MNSLNSGLPRKVARWRLWNLPATVGAQCTSNLEQVWIGLNWFVILSSPDVEVGKEGVEQLGELWLVMILRLRDPELKACTKIMMSLKRGNISQHPWHNHSPVYWVSAAAWSTVVVENPTILGVEVAVDTILTKQLFKLSKNVTGLSKDTMFFEITCSWQSEEDLQSCHLSHRHWPWSLGVSESSSAGNH